MTTSTSRPVVSVVLPTYRRFEPVLRTLSDLLCQTHPCFEVVVIDQNPSWPSHLVESRERAKVDPRVRWLTLPGPGVVAARNRGVAAARGEILWFVDDDVEILSRDTLGQHAGNYDDPSIAAVVGRERPMGAVGRPADKAQATVREELPPPAGWSSLQQAIWFDRDSDRRHRVCAFSTCNGSVRRSAFLAVDGFDERFAGNSYGDDADLALRLHARKFGIVYDPDAWLVHVRAPFGGLRLTDRANTQDLVATAQGLWLFVLRHGHRGMFGRLVVGHVLRKTVLLRRNLVRPWRQPQVILATARGLWRAVGVAGPATADPHRS